MVGFNNVEVFAEIQIAEGVNYTQREAGQRMFWKR